ncbi:DUF2938 domain-containing protein [Vibrio rumoiensis]|uniref:DUF2938 domain-containing protein n=1 Tax=Vibrio rumoiensis TaxID=76258 RepID=A0ABW7IYS2_9VIBR
MSILSIIVLGIGATIFMDIWALIQQRLFGIPPLNYALVGRWIYCLTEGKLMHRSIIQTPKKPKEKALGWALHYLIGVMFVVGHVSIFGQAWLSNPSLTPALFTSTLTLILPFFIMQPCFGFGIAASRTPTPWRARVLSLMAHTSYGLGLFLCALLFKNSQL